MKLYHRKFVLCIDSVAWYVYTLLKSEGREMKAIQDKVFSYDVDTLVDMARRLVNDFRDGADIVLTAVLNELEKKLPEKTFIAFCNSL